jgi:hypothetical protein
MSLSPLLPQAGQKSLRRPTGFVRLMGALARLPWG